MAIYIRQPNKENFRKTKLQTAVQVEDVMKGTCEDSLGLNKQVKKGNDVFCYVDPYDREINSSSIIRWCKTQDEAKYNYSQSSDDI
jgi:hypothetical protein